MFWAIKKYSLNFAMGRPAHFPRADLIMVSALWAVSTCFFSFCLLVYFIYLYILFILYLYYFSILHRLQKNAERAEKTVCVCENGVRGLQKIKEPSNAV